MTTENWLPLTEYSSKFKVSISTLRRRIRSNKAEHKYVEGKYLLKDSPLSEHNPNNQVEGRKVSAPPQSLDTPSKPSTDQDQMPVDTTHKLLEEIKKAYTTVLQEKEEQAMILKDEVADLQTLVRVLESDNKRLKESLQKAMALRQESHQETYLPKTNWSQDLELE